MKIDKLRFLIPSCLSFGPTFMVIGLKSYHVIYGYMIATIGTSMLVVGLVLLYKILINLEKKIEEVRKENSLNKG